MANKPENVSPAKPKVAGGIFVATVGTTLPTDAASELDVAFKSLGYISEDGLKNDMPREYETTKDWSGATIRENQTSADDKFKYKMLEALNEIVLKEVFGDENVTVQDGKISIKKNTKELSEHAYVIDMILLENKIKRIVVPRGKITSIAEVEYVANKSIGYDVTLSAYVDSEGQTHYEYIA